MTETKIEHLNRRLKYVKRAIDIAMRYCDWGDIDYMANLVEGIESAKDVEKAQNLYRNTIAFIFGFRTKMPEEIDADPSIIAKAQEGIISWCVIRGHIKPWQENPT